MQVNVATEQNINIKKIDVFMYKPAYRVASFVLIIIIFLLRRKQSNGKTPQKASLLLKIMNFLRIEEKNSQLNLLA